MTSGNASFTPIGPLPTDPQARLRYAAQQFEALWISHVLKEARGQGGTFLDKSMGSRMFRDMLDEAFAQHMAERGAFGLADRIVAQMQPAAFAGNLPSLPPAGAPEGARK
jgi:Rod binding domain-containing protein